ncbi:MAG: hypothetical protein R2875_10615 [Desulfobacterales bacterium]
MTTGRSLPVSESTIYPWDENSTYIKELPFFQAMNFDPPAQIRFATPGCWRFWGIPITTDHISPAGAIPGQPGVAYLDGQGAKILIRMGPVSNHEVMMRGTFGNVRLRNDLAPGTEGGWTKNLLTGDIQFIYDAAMAYQKENISLVVIAGKEYGTGSSRDWAAKAPCY